MNPETADLLSQLRDIHSAPPVPWWPPAPGWWILAALLLVVLFLLLKRIRVYLRARARRRAYLDYLEKLVTTIDPASQPQTYLASVNRVLKKVALSAFPADDTAGLKGAEWVDFLRRGLGQEAPVSGLDALVTGPYEPTPSFDAESLTVAARHWIKRHG
jgi:hypothetical protein